MNIHRRAAVLAAVCAATAFLSLAAETQRTVCVRGRGTAQSPADTARFTITISHTDDTIAVAQAATNAGVRQAAAILANSGIPIGDRQTGTVSLGPEYEWDDGKRVLKGQNASQSLSVTVRDLGSLAGILDALASVDGIQIPGISISSSKTASAEREARARAAQDATAKALAYAGSFGLLLGNPTAISETWNASNSPYMELASAMAARDTASGTLVETGSLEVSAEADFTFELFLPQED